MSHPYNDPYHWVRDPAPPVQPMYYNTAPAPRDPAFEADLQRRNAEVVRERQRRASSPETSRGRSGSSMRSRRATEAPPVSSAFLTPEAAVHMRPVSRGRPVETRHAGPGPSRRHSERGENKYASSRATRPRAVSAAAAPPWRCRKCVDEEYNCSDCYRVWFDSEEYKKQPEAYPISGHNYQSQSPYRTTTYVTNERPHSTASSSGSRHSRRDVPIRKRRDSKSAGEHIVLVKPAPVYDDEFDTDEEAVFDYDSEDRTHLSPTSAHTKRFSFSNYPHSPPRTSTRSHRGSTAGSYSGSRTGSRAGSQVGSRAGSSRRSSNGDDDYELRMRHSGRPRSSSSASYQGSRVGVDPYARVQPPMPPPYAAPYAAPPIIEVPYVRTHGPRPHSAIYYNS